MSHGGGSTGWIGVLNRGVKYDWRTCCTQVMLLLLDQKIEGKIRERMIVSFLRYQGMADLPSHTEVCKLCRETGPTM